MAKSWEGLQRQVEKVKDVLSQLAPPEPDDEFEVQRRAAIEQLDKTVEYTQNRVEQG